MLIKDKDILVDTPPKEQDPDKKRKKIKKENTKQSWGDAFDAYLRGITEKYLAFHGRASRLEFWGFAAAAAIISIPLSVLAYYIDMPELPYYFAGVTLIPFAAVFSRRLHDTGRRTAPYLISVFVPVVSLFFIGWYAFALLIVWIIFNVYALSQNSEPEENLYGEPEEDDLLYGSDHQAIIGKFRFIALFMLTVWIGLSMVKFDNWNRQSQQTAAVDNIMVQLEGAGAEAGLSPAALKQAEQLMKEALRAKNGQVISEKDIQKQIQAIIRTLAKP